MRLTILLLGLLLNMVPTLGAALETPPPSTTTPQQSDGEVAESPMSPSELPTAETIETASSPTTETVESEAEAATIESHDGGTTTVGDTSPSKSSTEKEPAPVVESSKDTPDVHKNVDTELPKSNTGRLSLRREIWISGGIGLHFLNTKSGSDRINWITFGVPIEFRFFGEGKHVGLLFYWATFFPKTAREPGGDGKETYDKAFSMDFIPGPGFRVPLGRKSLFTAGTGLHWGIIHKYKEDKGGEDDWSADYTYSVIGVPINVGVSLKLMGPLMLNLGMNLLFDFAGLENGDAWTGFNFGFNPYISIGAAPVVKSRRSSR